MKAALSLSAWFWVALGLPALAGAAPRTVASVRAELKFRMKQEAGR